ncbi:YbaB/EbfC DNA-binding family protein [Stackebrandtia albiflava]|uniref:YbaB/EbfC DNA-binding family protein n=1 Tax=Stackebrandtia albiflava TaxID=406432 RepID=A0A562UR13_9ACTN|nr:YbaB/EbfC family nucleoid-associated protein [Stackebrandtia albiflava]TWJ08062.1 YbaB/EbfC DNA-binding family protein [Stackebrandtia albiflava]
MTHPSADLAAQINTARISLTADTPESFDGLAARLGEIEFETLSPCRSVSVWMRANGSLADVVIADGAMDRRDSDEMAALIGRTITTAEATMRDALRLATKKHGDGA